MSASTTAAKSDTQPFDRLGLGINGLVLSVAGRYGARVIVPGMHACGLCLGFVGAQV